MTLTSVPQECCDKCRSTANCNSFAFSANTCWLKQAAIGGNWSADVSSRRRPGVVSGLVRPLLIDAFIFNHEYAILTARLEEYYDTVDEIHIFESNLTHQGEIKPYNFLENRDMYKDYESKIR